MFPGTQRIQHLSLVTHTERGEDEKTFQCNVQQNDHEDVMLFQILFIKPPWLTRSSGDFK